MIEGLNTKDIYNYSKDQKSNSTEKKSKNSIFQKELGFAKKNLAFNENRLKQNSIDNAKKFEHKDIMKDSKYSIEDKNAKGNNLNPKVTDNSIDKSTSTKDKLSSNVNNLKDDVNSLKKALSNLEEEGLDEDVKGYVKNLISNSSVLMQILDLLNKDNKNPLELIENLMNSISTEEMGSENLNELFQTQDLTSIRQSLNSIVELLDKVSEEDFKLVDELNLNKSDMKVLNSLISEEYPNGNNLKDIVNRLYNLSLEEDSKLELEPKLELNPDMETEIKENSNRKSEESLSLFSGVNKSSENSNKDKKLVMEDGQWNLSSGSKDEDKELNLLKNLIGDKEPKDFTKAFMLNQSLIQENIPVEIPGKEALVVNKATVVQDIIKSVKFMENNNMKELTVKIYPKELGQMVITLVLESDRMNAKIMASNKEAYNLLNSNLKDLKNGLLDINLRVDDIQVGIYAEDFMSYSNLPQGFAGGEFQQDRSRTSGQVRDINSASDEALLEDSNETIEDGTINILA